MNLEPVCCRSCAPVVTDRRGQEVKLEIGIRNACLAPNEGASLEMVGGAEPGAERHPLQADPRPREKAEMRVERDRALADLLHIDFQMILQVGANAWTVGHDLDPLFAQIVRRTDAGKHE